MIINTLELFGYSFLATFDHIIIYSYYWQKCFYDVPLKPTIKSHRVHYIKDLSIPVNQALMKA